MKKMILALVAVLAIAGTSFADLAVNVSDGVDLGNGLTSYLVTTTGASGFKGLTIDGGVNQVWTQLGATETQTPTDVIATSNPNGAPARAADTFFIFKTGSTALSPIVAAGAISETNTLAGSPVALEPDFGGFLQYKAGLGSIGDPIAEFGFGQDVYNVANELQLLQVVIPTGTQVFLTGTGGNAGLSWAINTPIGVPEPSTVLLLVAGFACLLVARFRK